MSEKTVKVQFEIDYNTIRKVVCILIGEVWDDQKLAEFLGLDPVDLNVEIFEGQKDDVQQVIAAVILAQKMESNNKKQTLKERIEEKSKNQ